jgi:hypothetical protein
MLSPSSQEDAKLPVLAHGSSRPNVAGAALLQRVAAFDVRRHADHPKTTRLPQTKLFYGRKAPRCIRSPAEEREHVVLLTTEYARWKAGKSVLM